MKRKTVMALAIALLVTATGSAHDLFMKLDSYFLAANTRASVRLLNGTFQKSDGLVARDRFRDISVYAPELSGPISQSVTWRDEGKTTVMDVQTGGPGTYLAGVSTKPREIDLKAAEFNDYLQHDGIPDTLAGRKTNNELNKDVRERYSKHVRAVFQVGDKLSDDYKRQLNYPAEVIPQQNPYALKVGDTISVLCMVEGQPVPHQFVMAGWESSDGKLHLLDARTNASGLATFRLAGAGKWYVKFIHMTPLAQPDLNYESKWASLTFEIRARRRAS
ncbi:MAG: DUF4198 domain-containing protein [Pyrinomonadaceae bacterium]|nr:DUF4198 domain-containing protein [Pyrinomonadaceae bacterium]